MSSSRPQPERACWWRATACVAQRSARTPDQSPALRSTTCANRLCRSPTNDWCPYCNIALRSLQQHHDAIAARCARLVAVSPQIPEESLSLTEKHQLAFHVLSDIGLDTAKQYGLAFDLPGDLAAVYDRLGFDLQRVNGGHARTLPLPATYVIDRAGTIRWAFVDTDYTRRAEPADILTALDALR
ncbi:hypothetical protein CA983_07275 [Streptomyces swartbergensis]|uniref:Thioredoxin domain-containing protein n=1 Tax=Streptomyces swartbergensis TaxID=487165 RepID=A0A243S8A9_9ACTN|nr:hypothetical protein CA983_07275 [Streptomyces swartbergensis]